MTENSVETANNIQKPSVIGRPFPPGVSGNPNGRPAGQRNYATIYRAALEKLAILNGKTPEELEDEMISSGILFARKGNHKFYADVLDRLYGKPTQKIEGEVRMTISNVLDELEGKKPITNGSEIVGQIVENQSPVQNQG